VGPTIVLLWSARLRFADGYASIMTDSFQGYVNSPRFRRLAVQLLLLVVLVFRWVHIDGFGLQFDEKITQGVVNNILHGDFRNNWKFAEVPAQYRIDLYNFSSYFYTDAVFVELADVVSGGPPANPIHWHRVGSVLAGTLAAFLFYLLALKWFDSHTALIFLAFLAVAPLLVQDAHYARPEAFELLLIGVVYLLSNKLREGAFRYSVLAAACACVGFLTAMKFSLLPMIAVVLFWVPADLWKDRAAAVRISLTVAGATILGMLVGVPDAFFHPGAYWNGVQYLRDQYAGVHRPHGNVSGGNTLNLEVNYFWQTLGPVLMILAVVGAVSLFRAKRKLIWASLCIPIAFYFAVFSLQATFFERNLSHVVPLMLMLSAAGLTFIVEYARARSMPRSIPSVLAMVLFIGAIAPPALLSYKIAFVAMATSTEERAKKYEENLLNQTGKSIDEIDTLLSDQQVSHLIDVAGQSERTILVRVLDYNDPFTVRNIDELGRHVQVKQVGFFPSLFTDLQASTLHTYHSHSLRYLLLSSRPETHTTDIGGWKFRRFGDARQEIQPGHVEMNSWVVNGFYPEVGLPVGSARCFGSWTQQQNDKNTGTLRMGPVELEEGLLLGIPIVTGPVTQGLSISVKDHGTGAELAHMEPPPVLEKWRLWQVDLPKDRRLALDIVASDQGSGYGQWLAIGVPRTINEMFFRLGEELPDVSATIKGSWTRDGYYPDVGHPPVDGVVYGSWSGKDSNAGSLHLGPIRFQQQSAIGIPLVTGPSNKGLSIKAVNTKTGKVIASLDPPPVHTAWWVWNLALPPEPDASIEIVAEDAGTGYGQWMAIGRPHAFR
jgi:hypothetical protein